MSPDQLGRLRYTGRPISHFLAYAINKHGKSQQPAVNQKEAVDEIIEGLREGDLDLLGDNNLEEYKKNLEGRAESLFKERSISMGSDWMQVETDLDLMWAAEGGRPGMDGEGGARREEL